MATKRGIKSGKKVKTLRARSLSGKKAKGVKGGSLNFTSPTKQTNFTLPGTTTSIKGN